MRSRGGAEALRGGRFLEIDAFDDEPYAHHRFQRELL
jgi:hypothetical protein